MATQRPSTRAGGRRMLLACLVPAYVVPLVAICSSVWIRFESPWVRPWSGRMIGFTLADGRVGVSSFPASAYGSATSLWLILRKVGHMYWGFQRVSIYGIDGVWIPIWPLPLG